MTAMATRTSTIEVPMSQAMAALTLKVVVTAKRRTRLRLWLGAQMIRAAGVVIGCNVEVSAKSASGDDKVELIHRV